MRVVEVVIRSTTAYSQSRPHKSPMLDKELHGDYDMRTWAEKGHFLPDGSLYAPPMAWKSGLDAVAKYLSIKIPGGRSKTYAQKFMSGVAVFDQAVMLDARSLPATDKFVENGKVSISKLRAQMAKLPPITKASLSFEDVFVNADGRKGGGTRVWRRFPYVPAWIAVVTFHILDDVITLDVFRQHLEQAGAFIGIGRWRPAQGGLYGRFEVVHMEEVAEAGMQMAAE